MEGARRLKRAVPCIVTTLVVSGCTLVGAPQEVAAPPVDRSPPSPSATATTIDRTPATTSASAGTPAAEPPSRGGNMEQYEVFGGWYRVLETSEGYDERGIASWYGEQFHGRPTSSGEPFDMNLPSAAHRTLPLPSWVRVTNLATGQSIEVRVNDRGPFHDTRRRIIDLSYAAARELGIVETGTASVRVEAIHPYQVRQAIGSER